MIAKHLVQVGGCTACNRLSLVTTVLVAEREREGERRATSAAVLLTQWKLNSFGHSISPRGPAMLKVQDRYRLAVSSIFLNYSAARDTHTPQSQYLCINLTEAAAALSLPRLDYLDIHSWLMFTLKSPRVCSKRATARCYTTPPALLNLSRPFDDNLRNRTQFVSRRTVPGSSGENSTPKYSAVLLLGLVCVVFQFERIFNIDFNCCFTDGRTQQQK